MNGMICLNCMCLSCSRCGCKRFSESDSEYKKRLQSIPKKMRCVQCVMCDINRQKAKGKCETYKREEVNEMSQKKPLSIETSEKWLLIEKTRGREFAKRVTEMVQMGGFSIMDAAEFLSQWDEAVNLLKSSGYDLSKIKIRGAS